MKKIFVILGIAGCFSLIYGVNNARAASSSSDAVVTYTCPDGYQLQFMHLGDKTVAYCVGSNDSDLRDPSVQIQSVGPQVSPVTQPNQISTRKKAVASRSATDSPKMVKKIVYEQVVEEDEE